MVGRAAFPIGPFDVPSNALRERCFNWVAGLDLAPFARRMDEIGAGRAGDDEAATLELFFLLGGLGRSGSELRDCGIRSK